MNSLFYYVVFIILNFLMQPAYFIEIRLKKLQKSKQSTKHEKKKKKRPIEHIDQSVDT